MSGAAKADALHGDGVRNSLRAYTGLMTLPNDSQGRRLPIKLDSTSNGEFMPVPLSAANRAANRLAHGTATENAKRLGVSRRQFLISSCGAASTLLAFNNAHGKSAGFYDLAPETALEEQLARVQTGPAKG